MRRDKSPRALIVGVGGLGCSAAKALEKVGVPMTLCDFDKVEERNLGRQDLYTKNDVGKLKVKIAAAKLGGDIAIFDKPFEPDLIEGHSVVLDCTDEPGTRTLIHQSCLQAAVPLIWAAVGGKDGQLATVVPGEGPCLRCLWKGVGEPAACDDNTDAEVLRRTGWEQGLTAAALLMGEVETGVLRLLEGKTGKERTIQFGFREECSCRLQH